jgi:hypothetical protein
MTAAPMSSSAASTSPPPSHGGYESRPYDNRWVNAQRIEVSGRALLGPVVSQLASGDY